MRRIRRRSMDFAKSRGIIISRVSIGDKSHNHPCDCRACVLCTCEKCISHIRHCVYGKGYQTVDTNVLPCSCRSDVDKFVCPLCKSYATFCYGQGLLCCARCASTFPQTDETKCVSVQVQNQSLGSLDHIVQEASPDTPPDNTTARSETISTVTRRSRGIDDLRNIISSFGSRDTESTSSGLETIGDCSLSPSEYNNGDVETFRVNHRQRVEEARRRYDRLLKIRGCVAEGEADLSRICYQVGRNKHVQTLLHDEVVRRNIKLQNDSSECDELVWELRTEAAFRTRDTDLPDLLKRKGIAWLRVKRPDMHGREKHLLLSKAINRALLDNCIDKNFRTFLRNQDPTQILVYNKYVRGAVVPRRGIINRFIKYIGFKKYADRKWVDTAYAVLPTPV